MLWNEEVDSVSDSGEEWSYESANDSKETVNK